MSSAELALARIRARMVDENGGFVRAFVPVVPDDDGVTRTNPAGCQKIGGVAGFHAATPCSYEEPEVMTIDSFESIWPM
jgi:hypothetical protein